MIKRERNDGDDRTRTEGNVRGASRLGGGYFRAALTLAAFALVAILALPACKSNALGDQDRSGVGTGSLAIAIADTASSRLVMPTLPTAASVAGYEVTLTREGYVARSSGRITDLSSFTMQALETGAWNLAVAGFDASGTRIFEGAAPVTIERDTTITATVTLDPVFARTAGGTGTVSLVFACDGFNVADGGWAVAFTPSAGGSPVSFTATSASGVTVDSVAKTIAISATLASGDWDMTFSVKVGDPTYVTASDVVKIYDGKTSATVTGSPIAISVVDLVRADRVRYVSNTLTTGNSGRDRAHACTLKEAVSEYNTRSDLSDTAPGVIILTENVDYYTVNTLISLNIMRPMLIRPISSAALSLSVDRSMTNSFINVISGSGDTGSLTLDRVTVKPTSDTNGGPKGLVRLSGTDGSARLTLKAGTTITGNKIGCGVRISGGTLVMETGSEISGNIASYGGGVYMEDGYINALELRGGIIRANRATIAAGGVALSNTGTLYVASGTWGDAVKDNQTDIAFPDLARGYTGVSEMPLINTALTSVEPVFIELLSGATISISPALTVNKPVVIIGGSSGSTLARANTANPIFSVQSDGFLTLTGSVTLDGQPASASMPLVDVQTGGTFVMNGADVLLINGLNNSGGEPYGGGVRVEGTFLLKDGSIGKTVQNSCFLGAGVFVAGGGVMTMTGGSIRGNSAEQGGGIFIDGNGVCYLHAGDVSNNLSNLYGGGIYVNSGGKLHVRNYNDSLLQAIAGNSSSVSGRGLYVASTPLPAGEVFFSTEEAPTSWFFLPGTLAGSTTGFTDIFFSNDFVIP